MSRNTKSKAFKTQDTPNAGRILVATRPIKKQEKILTDEASVVAPIVFCGQVTLEPNFYCITCFKNCVGNKKCPKCRLPICDKACAKNKVHLEDCPVLRDMFDDEDEDKSVVPSIEEKFQHLVLAASCLGMYFIERICSNKKTKQQKKRIQRIILDFHPQTQSNLAKSKHRLLL